MVFTKFAPLVALAAFAASDVSAMSRVDASVHRALRQQATVNLMITMKTGVDNAINSIKEADYPSRGDHIKSLVNSLKTTTKNSQQSVDTLLAQEATGPASFTSQKAFWISNQKVIKGATIELVEKLAAVPDIVEIREEIVIPLPQFTAAGNGTHVSLLANEWGVTKIDAASVWAAGFNGQGIVVGSLDTGVVATHTAIASKFRTTNGWFDATAQNPTPYDDVGHGTHTIGTMVGDGGIGVAPGAQFISCRGLSTSGGSESDLLTCAQFMTCPTDETGANADCSLAPNVVSNSWGGGQGSTFFEAAIKSWRAANIIPVFANGNAGPACKTANSPGDSANVIAVGATDSTDKLASFSSKGPSVTGLVKPEVSGPGVNVRSAWNTGDSSFNTISGTSMATPHVSGVVALLLSKNPKLTYAQVKTALTSTTVRALKASGATCGGTKDTTFPNNQYGYGRINAFRAANSIA